VTHHDPEVELPRGHGGHLIRGDVVKGGDRVQVRDGRGTSFGNAKGTVVSAHRTRSEIGYMVLLDGERLAIYFGPAALIPISEDSSRHITGGE